MSNPYLCHLFVKVKSSPGCFQMKRFPSGPDPAAGAFWTEASICLLSHALIMLMELCVFPFGKNAKTIKNRHTNNCAAWHASDIMLSCCLHVCDGCCSLITSAWTQIHIWRVFVCYSIKRPSSQFVTAPLKRNSENLWTFFLILGCFSWLTGVFTGYWQESSASTAE